MKIIIRNLSEVLSTFDPAEVDHIRVVRYFDIDSAEKFDAPHITYVRHFIKPIPKTGRILVVYMLNKENHRGTYHLYDPEISAVTFE